MILPFPTNCNFTFIAVPVWRLEPQQPADSAPPCTETDAASPAAASSEPTTSAMRLVLSYEYRPVARWYPSVNPGWDNFVNNDLDDARERVLRLERQRQEAEHNAVTRQGEACAAHSHKDAAGANRADTSLPLAGAKRVTP